MTENEKTVSNISNFADCKLPIQIRQAEDGEYYVEGYIYTTHMDRAKEDGADNTMFSKRCMEQIAQSINDGGASVNSLGASRAVSIMHDWIVNRQPDTEPIGMAVPPAEVKELEDGHFGVYCRTHINKLHPQFEDVKYRIEHGYYPGFSIEFNEGSSRLTQVKGRVVKFIESLKDFLGYGIVNARRIANPEATIESFGYRMVEDSLKENKEVKIMAEEKPIETKVEPVVNPVVTEAIQAPANVEAKIEVRTAEGDSEKLIAQLRTEMAKEIDALKISTRVAKTKKEETGMESINFRMMKEALASNELPKFRMAAQEYAVETDAVRKAFADPSNYLSRGLSSKGTLQIRAVGKGLQLAGDIQVRGTMDSGSEPESTYGQQGAPFADIYAGGLVDTFNNQVNLFGFLDKENHTEGGEYYGWELITDQNAADNTVHVDFDETAVTKSYPTWEKMRSPLKVARVGLSIADTTLRYSARSLGDIFQQKLATSMNYMMNDVDSKLFAETQDGAGNAPLGLEAVADATGNTTLYGKTRSTANRLTTGTLADTYVNQAAAITEAALRTGIQKILDRGTSIGRVAIVTSNKGKNYVFNLLDTNRRFNTTMAEFGFNQVQVATYDGIPIITDHNCNSTLATAASSSACLYFIDRDSDKIIVGMAPTVTNLAKVGAATEAYLEMDYAHVYKDPCRIHMIDNFSTG